MNPSFGRLGPPFIEKRGCHSGTQEVERVQCCEVILRITCQGTFNASCLGVLALSGTGESPVSSIAAPFRVDTHPGQWCPWCHVGRQAAEKIRLPPRRCLPNWLGRQLHANGGRGWIWRGPDGGPTGVLGKGLAGAPARVLLRRLLSSPARRFPGALWSSSAGIPPRVVVSLVRI